MFSLEVRVEFESTYEGFADPQLQRFFNEKGVCFQQQRQVGERQGPVYARYVTGAGRYFPVASGSSAHPLRGAV